MHKHTKLTEVMRKEVYTAWSTKQYSLRKLAELYHVDKKVISRIIARGKHGDFTVHDATNARYKEKRR